MRNLRLAVTVLVGLCLIAPSLARAELILSTSTAATLGGLAFDEGDLISYDAGSDTSTLLLDGSLFSLSENIDAVHLLANGHILLSTQNGATLGGLTFGDGDIVDYDPLADLATIFFSETLFSGAEDINGLSLLANGHIVLTTTTAATLGGLAFAEDDLAEYDPVNDLATLFFDGSNFSLGENIDGVHVLANGHIILSTDNDATLGGLTFNEADLVEYDPVNDLSTLFFDSSLFETAAENIDAQAVSIAAAPEPSSLLMLGLGLGACALLRRKSTC